MFNMYRATVFAFISSYPRALFYILVPEILSNRLGVYLVGLNLILMHLKLCT